SGEKRARALARPVASKVVACAELSIFARSRRKDPARARARRSIPRSHRRRSARAPSTCAPWRNAPRPPLSPFATASAGTSSAQRPLPNRSSPVVFVVHAPRWYGLEELRPLLRNFLRRHCRDGFELEDVVQETLLRAARYRGSLSDSRNLR